MTLLETYINPNIRLAKNFRIKNLFIIINEKYYKDLKVKMAKTLKMSDQE
jgi:hypothetical protein